MNDQLFYIEYIYSLLYSNIIIKLHRQNTT